MIFLKNLHFSHREGKRISSPFFTHAHPLSGFLGSSTHKHYSHHGISWNIMKDIRDPPHVLSFLSSWPRTMSFLQWYFGNTSLERGWNFYVKQQSTLLNESWGERSQHPQKVSSLSLLRCLDRISMDYFGRDEHKVTDLCHESPEMKADTFPFQSTASWFFLFWILWTGRKCCSFRILAICSLPPD